jgi:hypothetical protein
MVKSKLEQAIENMIILKRVTSPSGTVSDRAKRLFDKQAEDAAKRLKNRQELPENSHLTARYRIKNQSRARGMRLGIERFKQEYEEEGPVLQSYIDEQREVRMSHIEFGIDPEHDLEREFYVEVIKSLGGRSGDITDEMAEQWYEALSISWDRIGRVKTPGHYELLLPE